MASDEVAAGEGTLRTCSALGRGEHEVVDELPIARERIG
jgi:hypothetical protein